MSKNGKQLSNPFSTGGGGHDFEIQVQASFVALMLTGGFPPGLPCWPIRKIKLQGKYAGYDTDDLIVFVEQPSGEQRKLLGQIKHSINMTERDKVFREVIDAAWSDFNNPKVFTKRKDLLALITGPLCAADSDVRIILEWARHSADAAEFFEKVNLFKFSSAAKRKKLKAFRTQIKKANDDRDVSDEELFEFLRHFHLLGYDLDLRAGVTLSLLHSLIGQYSQENAQNLWRQLIEETQSTNKNAGTITPDTFTRDLKDAFTRTQYETIPVDFSRMPAPITELDWNRCQIAPELAIASLLGSWNERDQGDVAIVSQLAKEQFATWISRVRDVLQQPENPIVLRNGIWTVSKREELWRALGPRVFDGDLDTFKQCAVAVLSESDPQFDLDRENRFAASIHGKQLKHSHALRHGLAESLALLGSYSDALPNCSFRKAETTAMLAIRAIFDNANWVLWASLNGLLPLLAEADPDSFLRAVENGLTQDPCPFDEIFSQEGSGISGSNYLTGLLWALETLAWDAQYLVRVSVILGELASHDPGGAWANRPSRSISTIFLPWLPQTTASIEKRKVALQTLKNESPTVAWEVLLSLLPSQSQMSMGSRKPVWRKTIPEDWTKEVTRNDYWVQVSSYAEMAVEMATHDIARLAELVDHLDSLPERSFDAVLEHISSEDIRIKPENERLGLWNGLVRFASKHTRFADAKWAISPNLVSKIREVAQVLAPQNPLNLHRRLFSNQEFDLDEARGPAKAHQEELASRRQRAIKEILDFAGIDGVLELVETVEVPREVGLSLGLSPELTGDSVVLPNLLETERRSSLAQFTSGFIWGRYWSRGWAWVDSVDISDWSRSQIGQFLAYLPFTEGVWNRSSKWLGESEGEYWNKANVNPYQADCDLQVAIDKLIEHGRATAAIECAHKDLENKKLDWTQTVRVLLSAVSSDEPSYPMARYHILEIIKALRNAPDIDPDALLRVEWAYLPLLDGENDASPKLLENRLAASPDFFCEVIRGIYRSKKAPKSDKEPTSQERATATNAYRLLSEWRTPPGTQTDGGFSGDELRTWIELAKAACTQSGHLEVALETIGGVLIHCPPDPDGLWINRSVAGVLNGKDAEKMRRGFQTALFNSRGAYWIDPTGKPELELSAMYTEKAEAIENAGYQRLAVTIRGLADSYANEAKRITIEEQGPEMDSES